MKINWGKGLVIGMGLFMAFIVSLGVYMMRQPTDDYDHGYYEKGLEYEADIKKEKQVIADNAQPFLKATADTLTITFKAPAEGKVLFARPSDRRQDRTYTFKTDAARKITLPVKALAAGQWQLTFTWKNGVKEYLYKRELHLP